jgi:hypothetical protein
MSSPNTSLLKSLHQRIYIILSVFLRDDICSLSLSVFLAFYFVQKKKIRTQDWQLWFPKRFIRVNPIDCKTLHLARSISPFALRTS